MKGQKKTRKIITAIVKKLVSEYHPQKVVLFGSYAYRTPHRDGDIDLLIIKDTGERFIDRWTTVRHILSDPCRTTPLETLVLTPGEVSRRLGIGDQFLKEITERGEVLYGK